LGSRLVKKKRPQGNSLKKLTLNGAERRGVLVGESTKKRENSRPKDTLEKGSWRGGGGGGGFGKETWGKGGSSNCAGDTLQKGCQKLRWPNRGGGRGYKKGSSGL